MGHLSCFRISDLDCALMTEIKEFIYWLVDAEELPIAKALRQILVDKQKQLHFQQVSHVRLYVIVKLWPYENEGKSPV